ncbi:hypothetical protein AB0945_25325 [Streptomyces sp. NPDC005474]|uniref:hypothetical protein n=1 Tax=Streptomyces sp. NPDC005474 TaxID=3154878 RepID=UPI0034558B95
MRRRDDEFELYAQAVEAWNNHVNGLNAVNAYQLQDFYSYLLRLYDRIESNSSLIEQCASRETARCSETVETPGNPFIHQLALKVADDMWQPGAAFGLSQPLTELDLRGTPLS